MSLIETYTITERKTAKGNGIAGLDVQGLIIKEHVPHGEYWWISGLDLWN